MEINILCDPQDVPLIQRQLFYYKGTNRFIFNSNQHTQVSVNYVGTMIDSNADYKIAFVGEPSDVFYVDKAFCDKYNEVVTCQYNRKIADKVTLHAPCLPWQLGYSYEKEVVTSNLFDFDYNSKKSKLLSVISSNKTLTSTQIQRIEFVRKLKEHFGDACDVFGLDKKFDNKDEALIPYKFHVVIENNNTPHMWTEKLSDCLIANTFPIYYGCPNVNSYFKGIRTINIYDVDEAIATIEYILFNTSDEMRRNLCEENKELALFKYNLFSVIDNLVRNME